MDGRNYNTQAESGRIPSVSIMFVIVAAFIAFTAYRVFFGRAAFFRDFSRMTDIAKRARQDQLGESSADAPDRTDDDAQYSCPKCGAGLSKDAEVSPKGDVKCEYCKQWFSIHGS